MRLHLNSLMQWFHQVLYAGFHITQWPSKLKNIYITYCSSLLSIQSVTLKHLPLHHPSVNGIKASLGHLRMAAIHTALWLTGSTPKSFLNKMPGSILIFIFNDWSHKDYLMNFKFSHCLSKRYSHSFPEQHDYASLKYEYWWRQPDLPNHASEEINYWNIALYMKTKLEEFLTVQLSYVIRLSQLKEIHS